LANAYKSKLKVCFKEIPKFIPKHLSNPLTGNALENVENRAIIS